MTKKTWPQQRQEIVEQWQLMTLAASKWLEKTISPPPTLDRGRDVEQAQACAGNLISALIEAERAIQTLLANVSPHLDECIGYDVADGSVVELDLPTMDEALEWAELKHEHTDEDAAEEAAEHRGDMERDGT